MAAKKAKGKSKAATRAASKKPAPAKAPKKTTKRAAIVTRPAVRPSVPAGLPAPAAPPAPPAGSAEAFQQYLPVAQGLPASAVETFRIGGSIALHNVQVALAALAPYESQLALLPAPFDLAAMKAVLPIALGTVYAQANVDLASPGTTNPLIESARAVREVLLASAVALQKAGTLPAAAVARIQRGSGALDVAQDCVDLAALFTANAAAVAGKTPVTAAQIRQASTLGNQLLTTLKPKGAKPPPRAVQIPAIAARDAMGALLTQQYAQQVRRAGMWIWGDDVDAHVPRLGSQAMKAKKTAPPAAPPAKAPPPAPAG